MEAQGDMTAKMGMGMGMGMQGEWGIGGLEDGIPNPC